MYKQLKSPCWGSLASSDNMGSAEQKNPSFPTPLLPALRFQWSRFDWRETAQRKPNFLIFLAGFWGVKKKITEKAQVTALSWEHPTSTIIRELTESLWSKADPAKTISQFHKESKGCSWCRQMHEGLEKLCLRDLWFSFVLWTFLRGKSFNKYKFFQVAALILALQS